MALLEATGHGGQVAVWVQEAEEGLMNPVAMARRVWGATGSLETSAAQATPGVLPDLYLTMAHRLLLTLFCLYLESLMKKSWASF